jgi:hypothetical protein
MTRRSSPVRVIVVQIALNALLIVGCGKPAEVRLQETVAAGDRALGEARPDEALREYRAGMRIVARSGGRFDDAKIPRAEEACREEARLAMDRAARLWSATPELASGFVDRAIHLAGPDYGDSPGIRKRGEEFYDQRIRPLRVRQALDRLSSQTSRFLLDQALKGSEHVLDPTWVTWDVESLGRALTHPGAIDAEKLKVANEKLTDLRLSLIFFEVWGRPSSPKPTHEQLREAIDKVSAARTELVRAVLEGQSAAAPPPLVVPPLATAPGAAAAPAVPPVPAAPPPAVIAAPRATRTPGSPGAAAIPHVRAGGVADVDPSDPLGDLHRAP